MGLPIYELRTKVSGEQTLVWDLVRRKWMVLTPEEHVRQCLVLYLTRDRGVPTGLVSLEKGLRVDRRRKRYDLLVYDRNGEPLLACECKAPYVALDQNAALQLAVYNSELKAPFLLWTNGQHVLFYDTGEDGRLRLQAEVWSFEQMLGLV